MTMRFITEVAVGEMFDLGTTPCRKTSMLTYVVIPEEFLGEITYDPAIESKLVTQKDKTDKAKAEAAAAKKTVAKKAAPKKSATKKVAAKKVAAKKVTPKKVTPKKTLPVLVKKAEARNAVKPLPAPKKLVKSAPKKGNTTLPRTVSLVKLAMLSHETKKILAKAAKQIAAKKKTTPKKVVKVSSLRPTKDYRFASVRTLNKKASR